jgi:hypothetical protein
MPAHANNDQIHDAFTITTASETAATVVTIIFVVDIVLISQFMTQSPSPPPPKQQQWLQQQQHSSTPMIADMMMMMSSSFGNQSRPALNFSDFEDSTDDDMEKDDEEMNKYSNTKDQPNKDHTESSFATELLIGAALGMGSMGVAHALTKAVEGMISNDDVGMGDVADSWGSVMLLDPSSATSAASKVVSQEATNQL